VGDASLIEPLGAGIRTQSSPEYAASRVGNGAYAHRISQYFKLGPFSLTYHTACTSSSNALLDAAAMLESGVLDYALVLGVEMAARQSLEGFSSMQLLAKEAIRPFDQHRDGLVLGEALSVVLLSRDDIAPSRWRLRGGDSACETYSVTGVNPDGSGIAKVIAGALKNSGVRATDIRAVKAHGTASYASDLAEVNGMKRVFDVTPPFFSLKPYIGHTLGSCGVSELVLLMNAIEHGFLPVSPNFIEPDSEIAWRPLTEKQACDHGLFLLNCFGFGGNNNVMVIERMAA
jgi:3-oxoacyl-[acyl-carrier-protein] synthase-1